MNSLHNYLICLHTTDFNTQISTSFDIMLRCNTRIHFLICKILLKRLSILPKKDRGIKEEEMVMQHPGHRHRGLRHPWHGVSLRHIDQQRACQSNSNDSRDHPRAKRKAVSFASPSFRRFTLKHLIMNFFLKITVSTLFQIFQQWWNIHWLIDLSNIYCLHGK